MHPYRVADAPRRSRRLSKMSPKKYDDEGYETFDPELFAGHSPSDSTDASYSPQPPCPPFERPSPLPSLFGDYQFPPSQTRKPSEEHIPRPPNSFMLFRSHFWERQKHAPTERDHRQISKMAGVRWNTLSPNVKEHWRRRAALIKAEHSRKYPGYKYSPNPRRKARTQKKRGPRSDKREVKRCEEVAERLMRGESLESGLGSSSSLPRTTTPATSCSPVEVKVESPEPSLVPPPTQGSHVPSPSFSVVADHFNSPLVASEAEVQGSMVLQYPEFVKHDDDWDPSCQEPVFVPTEDIPVIDLPARAILPVPASSFEHVPPPALKEESTYNSPRVSTPVLPSDHYIDNYFGCKPDIYNLEPQQTVFTNPNGYNEVSSFSGVEQFPYTTLYEVPEPHLYYTQVSMFHGNVDFAAPQVPVFYSHPEVGTFGADSFDEDLLHELARSNPSYLFE